MLKSLRRVIIITICLALVLSSVGCSSSGNEKQVETGNYVKDDGTVVVDGIEIKDAFVRLQVEPLEIEKLTVEEIDVEEILVNCVTVEEITVLEAEVVSLNDEFVYLAYQNFVSYYDEDIDFQKFLTDVAIGGTCIIVCVTLSAAGGPIGTFFGAVITSEFTAATLAIGAAIDAAVSGYLAYQEGGDTSYIVGHMLNGVADGFKWAAMLAPVSGTFSGIQAIRAVNTVKNLDAFTGMSDKAINALLKDFTKIVKKVAKETADMSDDALKALYKQMFKELSGEITEEIFILAVRNQSDITRYIMKYNPFNTSSELAKALQKSYLSKAGLADDVIEKYIKQIQNKTIKSLDDVKDDSLRKYIEANLYEFVETFGKSLSNEFVDDCLQKKLGKNAFDAIKKSIATDDNAYCTLIETIGKETLDNGLSDADTLILLQVRYGSKNVNKLVRVSKLYSGLAGKGLVEHGTVKEIIEGINKGSYKTLNDVRKTSVTAANNLVASRNVVHAVLSDAGMLKKNAELLDDLVATSLLRYVDGEDAIRTMVQKNLGRNEIIDELGQEFYDELIVNTDQVIQCLALQPQMNTSLVREIFADSLSAEELSDEVIEMILAGVPISEWGLSDHVVKRIANRVATYYQKTDINCYSNFITEYTDLRASVANAYNLANEHVPINGKYAGLIMDTDNVCIKAKYGDIYMNEAGYPIFDQYAIARVEFNDLTGVETSDIRKANMLHHGSYDNPQGYTWHHVEDGRTMILIPSDLHDAYRHSGGASLINNGAMRYAQETVPQKALDMAQLIKANNGIQLDGYRGGVTFRNDEMVLPSGVSYKEYDIYPYVRGQNRGAERLVFGDDGSIYYTDNHYETFTRIE